MRCLGWNGDERDRDFFRWKHHENPFGRSPAWVAESEGRLAGFRTFLRWRFVHGTSGQTLEMVRAVDTATDPDFQGRGVFRDLTMTAVEELTAAGIDAVFNTPNDKSLPGYLKMGWVELGRPTVRIRPLSLRSVLRIAGARAPADLWPPTDAPAHGEPVGELPVDLGTAGDRFRTDRTEDFRSWRYSFAPLGYRRTGDAAGGSVHRIRSRGTARELAVCEVHGRGPALRGMGGCADHALFVGPGRGPSTGVPVPRQGPVVTWRPLNERGVPELDELQLTLGDVELF